MLIVGLTGGIGAGKSTVANMFAQLGALTIDADQLAREAIEPGSSGFDEVVDRLGQHQDHDRIDGLSGAGVF